MNRGGRTWGGRHPRLVVLAFVLALVFAAGATAWQGARRYAIINPQPGPVRPLGEPVTAPGFTVQITDVQRGYALPAAESGDPDVHGPAGSELVLVFFTATLTTADKDDARCDFALLGPDGTRWVSDSDLGYALRRPDAYGCDGGDTIAPGRPVRAAVNFLVPASAQDLVLEVGLSAFDQASRRQL